MDVVVGRKRWNVRLSCAPNVRAVARSCRGSLREGRAVCHCVSGGGADSRTVPAACVFVCVCALVVWICWLRWASEAGRQAKTRGEEHNKKVDLGTT